MRTSTYQQIREVADCIVKHFMVYPQVPKRSVTAVARSIILNGPYDRDGQHFNIKAKSIGPGVYELTREDFLP